MSLLRIYYSVWIFFGSEISLQCEEEDGEFVLEGGLELFGPKSLHVNQAQSIRNRIAEYDDIRFQSFPIDRRRGVVEIDAVGDVGEADSEGERLVGV